MNRVARFLLLALCSLGLLRPASAQIGISVAFGPPALPVYALPPCPGDGYLWTPGYWAWDPDNAGYYWIPGTWILAPQPGYLWTPGYWGWSGVGFVFHQGYWGPQVGFYGGINYGFGYFGTGFYGGRWDGGAFRYNTAVLNVNTTIIHNTYNDRTVINNIHVNRVSYNGGQGGINARPTSEQQRFADEHHIGPVAAQQQHVEMARSNPELRASQNQGRPPIAATARPADFRSSAVPAREAGGSYQAPPSHAAQLPSHQPTAPNTGNQQRDQQIQQQRQSLANQQNQEHQQLQQQQQRDDQQARQQNYNQQRQQQVEQQHQQQTNHMEQQHMQQWQQQQQREAPQSHEGHSH